MDLLVFNHYDMPEAGTQVIAGTANPREDLHTAILREVYEESGLKHLKIESLLLTTDHFHSEKQQHQIRNYFHLISTDNLTDSWSHTVSGDDEDQGMRFDFFWLPLVEAKKILTDHQGQAVSELND